MRKGIASWYRHRKQEKNTHYSSNREKNKTKSYWQNEKGKEKCERLEVSFRRVCESATEKCKCWVLEFIWTWFERFSSFCTVYLTVHIYLKIICAVFLLIILLLCHVCVIIMSESAVYSVHYVYDDFVWPISVPFAI